MVWVKRVRCRPDFATDNLVHARATFRAMTSDPDRLVRQCLESEARQLRFLRLPALAAEHFVDSTGLLVATIPSVQKRHQITAVHKVFSGMRHPPKTLIPYPTKDGIRSDTIQVGNFSDRIGIVTPNRVYRVSMLPGHFIAPPEKRSTV